MLPVNLMDIDKAKVDFVDQVDTLKRAIRALISKKVAGHAAKLHIDTGSQLLQSCRVAASPGTKKSCRLLCMVVRSGCNYN